MDELVRELERKGVLKSKRIVDALLAVDRVDFVPGHMRDLVYADEALPIGYGQTISQPYTVVFMLELLGVRAGDIVFEVGYGSGWQTVLLAHIVGSGGHIYACEIVPELCKFGEDNIAKHASLASRVSLYCQDASAGLPKEAKNRGGFDRIVAAASATQVPKAWRDQLKGGGVMVYPSHESLWRETKRAGGDFAVEEFPGFAFVPFVTDDTA
ncbi:MAG: hypothetical protein A3C84_04540 [Candidatus Ryanbacteria bacterium RIFCSPHIGHO2_02_FULL_48_12]|uniref:Protein-L-isoaspartate O-methyltransferase n=1 Tax=Candidatus Ryanbacteria bacterium RIFCSPHIGHO2_01_FULL_48_27 TaxID=1802115 RepID=A0A1G2G635_9BACT|nr:MAG: hypothetical protein A2756_02260 [Candidatus Ryanbacteria bacterium RIFCSPHIGHO2_01_FULL_48_27]OGZ49847.1 MAG: hypothetical protein A3C84_04540 [Candidatus Ryanbacteria bacterium RIFCSPHIGHO2_02_FULL_48_12]